MSKDLASVFVSVNWMCVKMIGNVPAKNKRNATKDPNSNSRSLSCRCQDKSKPRRKTEDMDKGEEEVRKGDFDSFLALILQMQFQI